MVSKLRLCRATQSARASASATVPIASTSTASYSPKIKVDVIGSNPSGSPKGFGRSPTIVFPGAVKTFTLSVFEATCAVMLALSFSPFVPSIWFPFLMSELDTYGPEGLKQHPQPFKTECHPGRALTVLELGALADLDNIAVRIADVAANLAVLGYRLRNELGSSTFPQFIARLDIRNADIHKAVDLIRVGDAERHRRLVGGGPAPDVDKEPGIRELNIRRRAVAVACAQNATAEDLLIEASRPADVGDGEKMCDGEPLAGGHLIALLSYLYCVH